MYDVKKLRMYLVKTNQQVDIKMAKMSPQNNYKLKAMLITLQTIF